MFYQDLVRGFSFFKISLNAQYFEVKMLSQLYYTIPRIARETIAPPLHLIITLLQLYYLLSMQLGFTKHKLCSKRPYLQLQLTKR